MNYGKKLQAVTSAMTELKQRQPRLRDDGYLRWLRKQPCVICGRIPSDAAHVRFGSEFYGKREVGMGETPDDKWALSLCRVHHATQHTMNEQEWWRMQKKPPLLICIKMYSEYGGKGGRVKRNRKKAKILSAPFPKPHRKLKSK